MSGYKETDDSDFSNEIKGALTYFFSVYRGGVVEIYKTLGGGFPLSTDKKGNTITLQQAVGTRPTEASIKNGILKEIKTPDEYQAFLTALGAKIAFGGKERRSSAEKIPTKF